MTTMPMIAGFYWAKWKSSDEGTDPAVDYSGADAPWEIVEVVRDTFDDSPERCAYSVLLAGIACEQTRHAFHWGALVPPPSASPFSGVSIESEAAKALRATVRYKTMSPSDREAVIAAHTRRAVAEGKRVRGY